MPNLAQRLLSISPLTVYRYFAHSLRQRLGIARLYSIQQGPLSGINLWVNQFRDPSFRSMVKGDYDAFIYQNKKIIHAKDKTIWDIGAHIGYHTLGFAKTVGAKGQILAFEPNSANRTRLKLNLSHNPSLAKVIKVFPYALGAKKGVEKFISTNDVDSARSSGGYLAAVIPPLEQTVYSDFQLYKVKVETMDNIVKKNPRFEPDIIKLDVEGAEAEVLQGATLTLKKYHPYLLIEVHNISAMKAIMEILLKYNYRVTIVNPAELSPSRAFITCQ